MDLCLMIEGQEGVSWPEWVELAQACERHGIPGLFRSDHYMNLDGEHPERGSLDAWGTLCALAAVTTTVRLGTMVSPATFRHPSELAKLVATADQVSNGRIELGLGAGWHEREHEAYGFSFAPTKTRVDVLEEQLQIVRGAWESGAAQPFSFSGEHYTLRELDARPKPVQPRVPIIIGGSGGPRSVALAARYADEYNTPFPTIEDIHTRRAALQRACAAASRPELPLSIMTCLLVGADDAALHANAERLARKIGGDATTLVSDPPPSWIVGTADQVVKRLRELSTAGVGRVLCQHLVHDDLATVALIGERLAPALAPASPAG